MRHRRVTEVEPGGAVMRPPEMAGWNLALRFGLEVVALVGLAVGAWHLTSGGVRWLIRS